ncbi:hypothetical protein DFQ28_011570 [Apophysomyces sp. BC1034]|nr:hypothetical protein DFQ28_011570 [Apophysomyces sp. BC1034]
MIQASSTAPSASRPVHAGGSMSFHTQPAGIRSLLDDSYSQYPDTAEQVVLCAVRTWLRPVCDARRAHQSWQQVLAHASVCGDGAEQFDILMRTLIRTSCRPLDMRCRCASDLAHDEASLLQTIALLQSMQIDTATQLLGEWLPQPTVSGVLKMARWFAISLLDAGVQLRVRRRSVTYMH